MTITDTYDPLFVFPWFVTDPVTQINSNRAPNNYNATHGLEQSLFHVHQGNAEGTMQVFNFDPKEFQHDYTTQGFVHIASGITAGFLEFAQTFAGGALEKEQENSLKEWTFANKKVQFLFDFPEQVDLTQDVKHVVGDLTGLNNDRVTLCERHIKVYNGNAPPNPPPHKDRVASEVTVGIPLQVPEDSYLVLYPDRHREINPFSSTALHRASLDEEDLPEKVLADVEPRVLRVWPGDVVFFKGSSIYHERVNPANTSLLYLKFNAMNLDPLGEDPATQVQRDASLACVADSDDDALLHSVVMVSPRLEKISRHYTRLFWKEVLQLYVSNEKEVTIGEHELNLIKAVGDDRRRVADALRRTGLDGPALNNSLGTVRRLIRLGALDLIPQA